MIILEITISWDKPFFQARKGGFPKKKKKRKGGLPKVIFKGLFIFRERKLKKGRERGSGRVLRRLHT